MSQTIKLSATYSVSYRQNAATPDPSKPTLILLHCFATTLDQFEPQFRDAKLLNTCNLLAVDEIGHGRTITAFDATAQWNYWTNAEMVIDLIKKLSITKPIYILGVSQGGCIAARVALLEPDMIQALILIGSSMYAETEEIEKLGCANIHKIFEPWLKLLSDDDHDNKANNEFQVPADFTNGLMKSLLGDNVSAETAEFWLKIQRQVYAGDHGRKKLRQCIRALIERDGLDGRLKEITCSVLIIHGTNDHGVSVPLVKKMQKDFVNALKAQLEIIPDGQHLLTVSNAQEVNELIRKFVNDNASIYKYLTTST